MESNSLGVIGWVEVSQNRISCAIVITDRAYRIGQTNPVFVHKLLCRDTVEQRIHTLQQQKAKLASDLLSDADITNKLSPEMVRALLEE
jgi:SNF2 family DNA or RNA helicase